MSSRDFVYWVAFFCMPVFSAFATCSGFTYLVCDHVEHPAVASRMLGHVIVFGLGNISCMLLCIQIHLERWREDHQ